MIRSSPSISSRRSSSCRTPTATIRITSSAAHQAVIDPIAARTPVERKSGEISVLTPAEAKTLA